MSTDLREAIRAAYKEAFGAERSWVDCEDGALSISVDGRYIRLESVGKRWRATIGVKKKCWVGAIEDTAAEALQQAVWRWRT